MAFTGSGYYKNVYNNEKKWKSFKPLKQIFES